MGGQRISDTLQITGYGEVAGSATAHVCPTLTCKWVKFTAMNDNAGEVCFGTANTVTKPDGTTDTTTGMPVYPGNESDWLPVLADDLESFYFISAVGDDFTYIALG